MKGDLPAVICKARTWVKNSITCAGPPQDEIIADKVDCGVMRCAEFNRGIRIVIGHQELSQNSEFVCRFQDSGVNLVV